MLDYYYGIISIMIFINSYELKQGFVRIFSRFNPIAKVEVYIMHNRKVFKI